MTDLQIDPFKAEAALLFVEGQLYFQANANGQTTLKAVAHSDVRAAFAQVETDSGWLHPSVRRLGENRHGPWFVSFWEPEPHKLNLGPGYGEIEVPLPPMLFAGFGRKHCVWALPHRRLGRDTKLYHAPLPNVHSSGEICWGQNDPPPAEPGEVEKNWRFLLSAQFNGDLCNGKSQAHKADIRKQLVACAGLNRYPTKDLVSTMDTLGWWVDHAIRQGE